MVSDAILVTADIGRKSMKKILVLVLVLVAIALPLTAKTNLINFGYGVHGDYWGVEKLKIRSIGVDFIHVGGETQGFYSQLNPYFATSFKNPDGSTFKFSDSTESIFGANTILGYGGDFNFGQFGIILGGGVFLDFNYYNESSSGVYIFSISSGIGLGSNFYFQPGSGNFVVNAGLTLAWRPWAFYMSEIDSTSETNFTMTYTNFNIGIGWRTGGIGSKSSKTSSSGGGSDDDW